MKLAFVSDTHLGFDWNGPRQEDSFIQTTEALKLASKLADVIVMPGDIFDSRVPKQEVLDRSVKIFTIPLNAPSSGVTIVEGIDKNISSIPAHTLSGVPVVAIHGTHERRGGDLVNPIHILESAGLLIYLHCNTIVLEKDKERVAIAGISGVPEMYSLDVVKESGLVPVPNAHNIFMIHQNFKEYIYEDASFLTIDDLPKGYDLYVNGHVHWSDYNKEKKFLLPGSTIITQMRKVEAENPKGFYVYDTKNSSLEFIKLKSQRKLFYKTLKFSKSTGKKVVAEARSELRALLAKHPDALIKIKLKGSLALGEKVDLSSLKDLSPFVAVDDELSSIDFKKKLSMLREEHKKKSIDEIGLELLRSNLKETNYSGLDAEELLALLEEGDQEKLFLLLSGKNTS